MRVLIIEDEINNLEVIKHLLSTYCGDVEVVGNAEKVVNAIQKIDSLKPDLILLDVELDDGTGFDVLKGIGEYKPKVIFITGYEHYAIDAIKNSAIDYILKPVNIDELTAAMEKVKMLQKETQQLDELQERVRRLEPAYIWINDKEKSQKIELSEIEYIKADSVYSAVHLDSGKMRLTSFSLSYFESELKNFDFFRVHKSYLINLNLVVHVDTGRGGKVHMKSGAILPIAYRRKTMLNRILNQI